MSFDLYFCSENDPLPDRIAFMTSYSPNPLSPTQNLFAYGTLQTEAVQLSTFGRRLDGTEDVLVGYRLKIIRIDDEDFVAASGTADHRNLEFTGKRSDSVAGTVFKVTDSELEQADSYEPDGYERVLVQLRSGLHAWVYLQS